MECSYTSNVNGVATACLLGLFQYVYTLVYVPVGWLMHAMHCMQISFMLAASITNFNLTPIMLP